MTRPVGPYLGWWTLGAGQLPGRCPRTLPAVCRGARAFCVTDTPRATCEVVQRLTNIRLAPADFAAAVALVARLRAVGLTATALLALPPGELRALTQAVRP